MGRRGQGGIVDAQLPSLGARGSCTSGATHPRLSPSLVGEIVHSKSHLLKIIRIYPGNAANLVPPLEIAW